MLISITGPDNFVATEAINKIKAKYKEKNPDGLELIQIEPGSVINWADLRAVPLFASSRLVVIKTAGRFSAGEQDNLAHFLNNLPSTTVVVLWDEKKIDAKSTLAQVVKSTSKQNISAESLEGSSLKSWVSKRAKELGLSLTSEQSFQILDSFGGDLWAINNELIMLGNSSKQTVSTGVKSRELERFASFRLVRQGKWLELGRYVSDELASGMPVEMIMGGLASAIRKELRTGLLQTGLTDLLLDIDVGLKTGLLDDSAAIALIMAYLPQSDQKRVQWEELWEGLAYL